MKRSILHCLVIAAAMLLGQHLAAAGSGDNPPGKMFPGGVNNCELFYVFGPGGGRTSGREDSIQVLFIRVPAGSGQVSISVWDPGVGGNTDSRFFGTDPLTEFVVYGGKGAYSDRASQAIRPSISQPGTRLASAAYAAEGTDQWVTFGPFAASQGERVGEFVYFKLVAVALSGSKGNFFRVAATPVNAECFGYSNTIHLDRENVETVAFHVEVPSGTSTLIENNWDIDTAGEPFLTTSKRLKLRRSNTASWARSRVELDPGDQGRRLLYELERGMQVHSNYGFHFTDGDGNPLKVFFNPTAMPPPPQEGNTCTIQTRSVHLEKTVPTELGLGQEFEVMIDASALTQAAELVVTDQVPEGTRYVSSTPAAVVSGNLLTWKFTNVAANETQAIRIKLQAQREGELQGCATVAAIPQGCLTTRVGKPMLAITKTGPATARLGDEVAYNITVTNTGTAVARDVVVTDAVPAGLAHASGSKTLRREVGDLAPQQSRDISIALTAAQRGRHCNNATAKASNTDEVKAEACTVVVEPRLEITKVGTEEQFVNKTAEYTIVVSNPGDVDLTNVVVTDSAPTQTQIVKAQGGEVTGNTATWRLPTLAAGKQQTLKLTLVGKVQGRLCNNASVATAEGLSAQASACTLWQGYPALLLEVIDTVDPLLIGEATTYVIRVTNQGTADDADVYIVANFPREVSPTAASGDTKAAVNGKQVKATPYAVLKPKQAIEWTIQAKADDVGDARLKVEMYSQLLKTPVVEEESTHVY